MANENLVARLKLELESILKFKDLTIPRPHPIKSQDEYDQTVSSLGHLMSAISDLHPLPLGYLPEKTIVVLLNGTPQVVELLRSIESYDPENRGGPLREELYENIHQAADSLLESVAQFIPYLAYRNTDSDILTSRYIKATEDAEENLQNANQLAFQKLNEINGVLEKAKDAAAFSGASSFAVHFEKESKNLQIQSISWLCFALLFAGLTICTAAIYVPQVIDSSPEGNWVVVSGLLSKATIIAVFLSASIWCARTCRALMHQITISRHRSLSLKTFMAFVSATDDPFARDAVLLAATKSIFGIVPSGFVNHTTSEAPDLNLLELGKSANKVSDT